MRSLKWRASLVLAALAVMTASPGPASATRRAPLGPPERDVKVVNTDAEPVPVTVPEPLFVNADDTQFIRIPFTRSSGIVLLDGEATDLSVLLETPGDVPNGWTLVVHSFSYEFTVPAGQHLRMSFLVKDRSQIGAFMPQSEPFVEPGTGGWVFQDALHMPLYSRPLQGASGAVVTARVERSDSSGIADGTVSIAGYMIPEGTPHVGP